MTTPYSWLTRFATRHGRWHALAWIIILAVSSLGAARVQRALTVGGYILPGTQSQRVSAVLARDLKMSPDTSALVVFHSDSLLVTDRRFYDAVERSLANLDRDRYVTKTESFYSTGIPDMVSPDNHTTYSWVTLSGAEKDLEEAVPRLRRLVRSNYIEVSLVGQVAADYDIERASADDLVRVERFTFPIVFLLLVLAFGSLVAAAVPLVLGAACVLISLAVLFVLGQLTPISIFALNTASMIGLGLSIDFSLIAVSRFREELLHLPLERALDQTLRTSVRAITISGTTVVLTMAVLTLFPIMIIRSIALAIAITAGVAVLLALLLLPVLLAVLGRRINGLDLRLYVPVLNRSRTEMWREWTRIVLRRPKISLVLALGILALMAFPAHALQRRGVTIDVLPPSVESRHAVDRIRQQFGAGEPAPVFVVVEASTPGGLWERNVLDGLYALQTRLESDPRVAHVQSLVSLIPNPSLQWVRSLSAATIDTNPDRRRLARRLANLDGRNTTTVMVVYPRKDETNRDTVGLMLDLRAHARLWAPTLAGTQVLVGGTSAQHYDFDRAVYDQVPLLVGLSLLVTFVLLTIFFHSLFLPVKAILLNLISLVASYGILVLVFQWGTGDVLLGFHSLGAILSYTPVLLFSILFALSTDYEVFLLTRIREYARFGHSNEDAIALGVQSTAGTITAAGVIMIAVFGSFALTQVLVIKELGFGLAIAVLLDITLVRMILVPATMKLMGRWNWWMPEMIGRLVPEVTEGQTRAPLRLARHTAPDS